MAQLIYSDFIRADKLKSGDLFEHFIPCHDRSFIFEVGMVDIEPPLFNLPGYKPTVIIQANNEITDRICVSFTATEYVQKVEKERFIITARYTAPVIPPKKKFFFKPKLKKKTLKARIKR